MTGGVSLEDIAPKLLLQIANDFEEYVKKNRKIARLKRLVDAGEATYQDAYSFAVELAEALSRAFTENLSSSVLPDGKLYYNIAKRIIYSMMQQDYEMICDYAVAVQEAINNKNKINIKAVRPAINEDRIQGIVDIVSGKDDYDKISYMLNEPVANFSQSIIDDLIRSNADFQWKAGLEPMIVRRSTGTCCDWCDKIAGTYKYQKVSNQGNNVFRRHKNCKCLIEYVCEKTAQNVHTKKYSSRIENPRQIEKETLDKIDNK